MALPDQPSDVIRWEPQLPKDWCEALGKIVLFAAQVETQLHLAYWHYLGLSKAEGQIITGDINSKRLGEDLIKITRVNCKNRPSGRYRTFDKGMRLIVRVKKPLYPLGLE